MDLVKTIKNAVKDKKVVFGYSQVLNEIKSKKPKLIVYSKNSPPNKLNSILHNSKLARVEVKEFEGDNMELGLICGKPFSVSVLAIKGSEK